MNGADTELLAGLQDIRLPDNAPGGLLAEIAVAVAFGLLLALALSFVLALFTTRQVVKAGPRTWDQQRAAIDDLPASEQPLALIRLLKTHDPVAAQAFADRLYVKDGFPSLAELRAALQDRHG